MRCKKRKQDSECVYVVSNANPGPTGAPRPSEVAPVAANPAASPDGRTPTSAAAPPGYLGFTSFSTVYEEIPFSTPSPGEACTHDAAATNVPGVVSQRTLDMCLAVLRYVPDPKKGVEVFQSRTTPLDGWMLFVARRLLKSFYETIGQYLGRSRKALYLGPIARKICHNTAKPLSDEKADSDEWVSQFSGDNLRWESLGVLFTFWDLDGRTAVGKGDRKASTPVNRECLGLCVDLCREFSQGNSLMVYLTYRRMMAESLVSGDASLSTWRYHAETVALLTFLGFHAEPKPDAYLPRFSSEIKRKLCAMTYILNMICVSFTGRPPLLSRRHCSTPLPLDLKDDDLELEHDLLEKSADSLDKNGWNLDGGVYSATVTRALGMLAAIREEIFDITLSGVQSINVDSLMKLKAREFETTSEFPSSLRHSAEDIENSEIDVNTIYSRLLIQLEHLQNIFFIERLLLRHGHEETGKLLVVSFEMVTHTLPLWTHERLAPIRHDIEWIVMAYAAPAGGILCMELLKPKRYPLQDPKVTRSSMIQKLSLLVGFLDWVNPSAPNGELCHRCKSVIQGVLDSTLNNTASGLDAADAPLDWDFSTQVDFNFDLLNTFDLLRPDGSVDQ